MSRPSDDAQDHLNSVLGRTSPKPNLDFPAYNPSDPWGSYFEAQERPFVPRQPPPESAEAGQVINPGFLVQDLGPTGEDDDRTARIWGGVTHEYFHTMRLAVTSSEPVDDVEWLGEESGGFTATGAGLNLHRVPWWQNTTNDIGPMDFQDVVFDGDSGFFVYIELSGVGDEEGAPARRLRTDTTEPSTVPFIPFVQLGTYRTVVAQWIPAQTRFAQRWLGPYPLSIVHAVTN